MSDMMWTFEDVMKRVPKGWRGAEIAIGTSIDTYEPVRRIELVDNVGGKRLIIIRQTGSRKS